MKTINDSINERLARARNIKKINLDNKVEEIYGKYPKLRKTDSDLVEVRVKRMMCAVDGDNDPVPALNKREEELREQRQKIIEENNIDPKFDEEKVLCAKCSDTGFTSTSDGRRVVCTSCMKGALEEAYTEAGLKDYASYTLKNFEFDRFKDGGARKRMFEGIRDLLENKSSHSLMVLTGGVQSGKTYLSVVACKYAILQGMTAYYIKADKIAALNNEDIEELKSYDLIVIDDYAPEITGYYRTAAALHELLEARLATGRATVIVSSSALEVLVSDSDERIAGKLRTAGKL